MRAAVRRLFCVSRRCCDIRRWAMFGLDAARVQTATLLVAAAQFLCPLGNVALRHHLACSSSQPHQPQTPPDVLPFAIPVYTCTHLVYQGIAIHMYGLTVVNVYSSFATLEYTVDSSIHVCVRVKCGHGCGGGGGRGILGGGVVVVVGVVVAAMAGTSILGRTVMVTFLSPGLGGR